MGLDDDPKIVGPIKTPDNAKKVGQHRDPEQARQLEKLGRPLDKLGQRLDKLEETVGKIESQLKALAQDPEFQRNIANGMEVLKREDPVEYERILKIFKGGLG